MSRNLRFECRKVDIRKTSWGSSSDQIKWKQTVHHNIFLLKLYFKFFSHNFGVLYIYLPWNRHLYTGYVGMMELWSWGIWLILLCWATVYQILTSNLSQFALKFGSITFSSQLSHGHTSFNSKSPLYRAHLNRSNISNSNSVIIESKIYYSCIQECHFVDI